MARPPSPQITPHTRRTRLERQLHGVQGLGRPADDGQGDHVLPRVHLAGPALRNRDALSGPAARPPGELGFSAGRGWLTAAQLRSGQASRVWWRRRLEGSSPTASPGRACRERAAGFAPGVRTAPLENAGGATAVASGKRPPAAGRPSGLRRARRLTRHSERGTRGVPEPGHSAGGTEACPCAWPPGAAGAQCCARVIAVLLALHAPDHAARGRHAERAVLSQTGRVVRVARSWLHTHRADGPPRDTQQACTP